MTAVIDQITGNPSRLSPTSSDARAASVALALVPGALIESPAHLLISGARNTIRHGVEPREADELTGLENLKSPEPKTLLIEACIDAVDEVVTLSRIQRSREVAHHFGVGVQRREGCPVRIAPTPHQKALCMDLPIVRHQLNLLKGNRRQSASPLGVPSQAGPPRRHDRWPIVLGDGIHEPREVQVALPARPVGWVWPGTGCRLAQGGKASACEPKRAM